MQTQKWLTPKWTENITDSIFPHWFYHSLNSHSIIRGSWTLMTPFRLQCPGLQLWPEGYKQGRCFQRSTVCFFVNGLSQTGDAFKEVLCVSLWTDCDKREMHSKKYCVFLCEWTVTKMHSKKYCVFLCEWTVRKGRCIQRSTVCFFVNGLWKKFACW